MTAWCGRGVRPFEEKEKVMGDIGEKRRHVEIPAEEPFAVPATVPAEPQPAEPVPA